MAGSSRKNSVLRARIVNRLPSRAKACASSSATTKEPITARRAGIVSLSSASVEVQYGGPEASEVINLFGFAMRSGMISADLKYATFAYPTAASDIESMVP
jgi:pyruvate/2-oxoglutarate dehydrogenase complex dihydrolipoamide dehydrogenase (E3) component